MRQAEPKGIDGLCKIGSEYGTDRDRRKRILMQNTGYKKTYTVHLTSGTSLFNSSPGSLGFDAAIDDESAICDVPSTEKQRINRIKLSILFMLYDRINGVGLCLETLLGLILLMFYPSTG